MDAIGSFAQQEVANREQTGARAVPSARLSIVVSCCDYRLGSCFFLRSHLLGKSRIQNLSSFLINSAADFCSPVIELPNSTCLK